MQMDYINTSHPSFIGGSKAVELALQQNRIARQSKVEFLYFCLLIYCCICYLMCICLQDSSELKDPLTERNSLPAKSRAILGRATQVDQVCILAIPVNRNPVYRVVLIILSVYVCGRGRSFQIYNLILQQVLYFGRTDWLFLYFQTATKI